MAATRIAFTRKSLAEIQPTDTRTTYQDTTTRGLILDVTPNGVKSFRVYRKVNGRPERFTLGRFNPDLPESREFPQGTEPLKAVLAQPELNVKMARRLADAVNAEFDAGRNPAEVKRQARGELTLGELFDKYCKEHAEPQKVRTLRQIKERYQRHLGELPDEPPKKHGVKRTKSPFGVNWHNRKLSDIQPDEVRRLHLAAGKHLSGSSANQIVDLLRQMYRKAEKWGDFKGTIPTCTVEFFDEKSKQRERFLQPDEMPRFWQALDDEPNQAFKDFVLLAILTGARSSNIVGMARSQINLQNAEWIVPNTASKNGQALRIVLVPEAVEILARRLEATKGEWVFPAKSKSGHMTIPRKPWDALCKRAGFTEPLWRHDLRRSLGSWQARTGASLVIIGKSLGHNSQAATQIYARLDTDPVRDAVSRATQAMLAARNPPAEAVPLEGKAKRKA